MLWEFDDVIEYGKAEELNGMVLSVDYAKAFDRVKHENVIECLKDIGLDGKERHQSDHQPLLASEGSDQGRK